MDTDRQYIWLDCDPGHDDAFAIMLACYQPNFELLGISTIMGNQTVDKTTVNALKVLELIGKGGSVDVVQGVQAPLVRPSMICPEIHGLTGLDCSIPLPTPKHAPITDRPAIQVMAEKIRSTFKTINNTDQSTVPTSSAVVADQQPDSAAAKPAKKITIVATGSLTNVALLFIVYPDIKSMVDVSLMGGCINIGNMSPAAEFNILVDPEAAKVVYESGVKITMVPLEVTHKALVTPAVIERIQNINPTSNFVKIVVELLKFFSESYQTLFDFPDPPLHDPLAVAYLINPNIFKCKVMRVDIETGSSLTLGRTVCDIFNFSKLEKNVNVCTDVDIEKFWDMLIDSLVLCDKASKI
ncbi:hypothetical protein CYY_008338 [Polysphondylium violaceum]|uniref:Inosine/uridine-preferring nucleoside hydrolase domain-containing protein n=1 Tax=Polysphondylium violaceum TaxID=133409 RepID=A0A8J4UQ87_9MYCE|nr:hypothetical protein CYY_008338 [Polysphondylium violaceum]